MTSKRNIRVMPKYIKSHSNYVLKSLHQSISNGNIYERDITTIGGIGTFPNGQTPIYRSNNFIITVRDDGGISNQYNRKKWNKNKDGDVWTMTSLEGMTSEFEEENDTKIVLKQDYYDFNDFAYYGSLSELLRVSINDIINRFPGELYGTSKNIYYTNSKTIDGELIENKEQLGDDQGKFHIANPFGINMHTLKLPKDADPLKFFSDGGYKNYVIVDSGGTEYEINEWNVDEYYSIYDSTIKKYIPYTASTYSNHPEKNEIISGTPTNTYHPCKGEKVGAMDVNHLDSDQSKAVNLDIYAYLGDDNIVYYLSNDCQNVHIRPNSKYITKFYNECDNFQKLLMNQKTIPKYKATFSVIHEDENGYYRKFEDFIFPTSEGGYNIDATTYGFNSYTTRLSEIGEFYDERFTDNLYRSMTHEAIKNFDWTYTRQYQEGDEEEYVIGGQKVQKALRVFAREFDEILVYINNINNLNRVTYDERSNLPDYFLTDTVENEGWNVVLITPYETVSAVTDITTCDDVFIPFTQPSGSVKPYVIPNEKAYFLSCCSGGTQFCGYSGSKYHFIEAADGEYTKFDECSGALRNRIKRYTDDREYTYQDANNEFLRRLKLNSRYIWRHKGTLDGIDMILGMFGMRSDKFYNGLNACQKSGKNYDYYITEYTAEIKNPICDNWDAVHQMNHIDWINSTKTITYDYRSVSNYNRGSVNVDYLSYQGLPVSFVQSGDTRYLYPNFNKIEQYDGNPYFQMNGGWLDKVITSSNASRHFQFNADDYIVLSDNSIHKETVRNVRRFDTLQDMLSVPSYEIHDGQVVYVSKIDSNIAVLDGMVYEIKRDSYGSYIELVKQNGVVRAGDELFFTEFVRVYNRNKAQQAYYLDTIPNGQIIKAYISGTSFVCSDDVSTFDRFSIIKTTSTDTNYFEIDDFSQSNRLQDDTHASGGWKRLKIFDTKYKMLSTIINDNKGNNPHNGMMKYDNGREYFKYFEQLFKYSIENDMFDERCYDNYETSLTNDISTKGFEFNKFSNFSSNDYYKNDSYTSEKSYTQYQSGNRIKTWGKSGITVSYKVSKIHHISNKNDITNNILNTKVIRITFRLHNDISSTKGMAELKYIDNIVLNYLTQMIPSTAILQIKYEKR